MTMPNTMRTPRLVAALLMVTAVALVSCAARKPPTVVTEKDPEADFRRYRTYAWKDGSHVTSPAGHARIVAAIDAELAAHGYRQAQDAPDLFVSYHGASERRRAVGELDA